MSQFESQAGLRSKLRASLRRVLLETSSNSSQTTCRCGCSSSQARNEHIDAGVSSVLESYYPLQSESLRLAAEIIDSKISRLALRETRALKQINHLLRRVNPPGGFSLRGLLSDTDALKMKLAELSSNPYVESREAARMRRDIGQIVQEVSDKNLRRHLRDVHHTLGECSCNQSSPEMMYQPESLSTYRPGTPEFFSNAKMLKSLLSMRQYSPADAWESELLGTDIGEWSEYEGALVPLDFPIIEVEGEWDEPCETCSGRVYEAKYKGKEVELGKPKRGGGRAYVYVRDPKTGNVKKVSFGSSMPDAMGDSDAARKRRKSFGNRHNCAKKKDRTQAGYWSCRATKFFGRNIPGWW